MKYKYFIEDKETKQQVEVTKNIFLSCFGEIPISENTKLENNYCVGFIYFV